ncbi:MAG TPA: N-formylglutamate amidohydrolase [Polyangiaceae bacterium]|nr:N-formylglutamate amidohydrolase [Polyangiaceae bacterium]
MSGEARSSFEAPDAAGAFVVARADAPGPIVVEIPHAGLVIDAASARFTSLPPHAASAGALRADADLGADAIWEGSERRGVTRLVACTHRYVIDLNTDPRPPPAPPFYEERPPSRPIIRRSAAGVSWREDALPPEEIDRRIREIFEPYHAAIDEELARSVAQNGRVLLIASHTFPDRTRAHADVVLGTHEGRTLGADVRDAIAGVLRSAGLSVALERPFPGGFSLARHARPEDGVVAIQIEIARRVLTEGDELGALSEVAVRDVGALMTEVVRASSSALGLGIPAR